MYAFLLTLGAVIIAAGLGLIASGISLTRHAFDATNVTPGIVAITGGCILLGLAFVVRGLLRVEYALLLRPIPRAVRPGEGVDQSAPTAVQAGELERVPFPTRPRVASPPPPMPISGEKNSSLPEPAPAQVARIPALENAPVVEESGVSLLPLRAEEENTQLAQAAPVRLNGSTHGKATARAAVSGTPAGRRAPQPKSSIFDSLWPKSQRGAPEPQPLPPVQVVAPPAAVPPALDLGPPPASRTAPALQEVAVSILKSGVVEGMAYTLYSDGSIEAQLPDGTLRFRSITELRNHIEQNS